MKSRALGQFGWLGAACGVTIALAACGGGKEKPSNVGATAAAPGEAAPAIAAPAPGAPPAGATGAMVALGDSIFRGASGGGTCYTCHGADARGTALAPSLVDSQWLTGDGSYAFIQKRVTEGMPTPTAPYTAAMPPMGGASLSPDQVRAVAAYVYAISHK